MSAKNKREKAREKRAEKTGLTVARLRETLSVLPADARVRAIEDDGGGRLLVEGEGVAAIIYNSGESEVEYAG